MKMRLLVLFILNIGVIIFMPTLSLGQFGNTVSGYIFTPQRQPLNEITVELLDDYSRSVARTRTNNSGRYVFERIPAGRFKIRVLCFDTNYEEQEQEFEIQNLRSSDGNGRIQTSGYDNVQRDFYLKLRKSNQVVGRSESIFIQEIPTQAKETYKKAIESLDNKKQEQGLLLLRSSIELFPDYYDALEKLGSEYIKLQHFVPAQILLQKAVDVNSRSYKGWYGLAYSFYSQNKTKEAIEAVEKAISLNQFSVESLLLSGVLSRKAKNFEQAEKQLIKAKDLAKNSVPEVYWHLALLYGNDMKRFDRAADELELFLKVRSNSKDAGNIKKLIADFREKAKKL
jgi:tetratricopeptide (TPR) repeat protein